MPTEPIGVYGQTKRRGEEAIQLLAPRHIILRTSWLYAPYGANFMKTMLRLGKERPEMRVVFDQVGTPTSALDLSRCIVGIIEHRQLDKTGLYHFSNEGVCSWYDFAEAIFRLSGYDTQLHPIRSSEYPTRAERPITLSSTRHVCAKPSASPSPTGAPHWRNACSSPPHSPNNPLHHPLMHYHRSLLITGGAGFIGSHVVRLLANKYPQYHIVCLDKLTYAGNLKTLEDVASLPNYTFVEADICNYERMRALITEYAIDGIIHLAAESHVDRSISDPFTFARTNVMGTLSLLEAARVTWGATPERFEGKRFYHISTDEVYGALEIGGGFFTEETKYAPHSPYSASKASSDHFVRAYHDTYGLPTIVTNCSNNYGPYQFPEKLIPLFIDNIRKRKPLPVYGKGENIRDWLFVEDHARAIDLIFHKGKTADTYNIGGFNEWCNIDLIHLLVKVTDRLLGNPEGHSEELITFVTDRAGHDLRYAIDSSKLHRELGWEPSLQFEEGLEKTVKWYLEHQDWIDHVSQRVS